MSIGESVCMLVNQGYSQTRIRRYVNSICSKVSFEFSGILQPNSICESGNDPNLGRKRKQVNTRPVVLVLEFESDRESLDNPRRVLLVQVKVRVVINDVRRAANQASGPHKVIRAID
jgi:hypothetical protein